MAQRSHASCSDALEFEWVLDHSNTGSLGDVQEDLATVLSGKPCQETLLTEYLQQLLDRDVCINVIIQTARDLLQNMALKKITDLTMQLIENRQIMYNISAPFHDANHMKIAAGWAIHSALRGAANTCIHIPHDQMTVFVAIESCGKSAIHTTTRFAIKSHGDVERSVGPFTNTWMNPALWIQYETK